MWVGVGGRTLNSFLRWNKRLGLSSYLELQQFPLEISGLPFLLCVLPYLGCVDRHWSDISYPQLKQSHVIALASYPSMVLLLFPLFFLIPRTASLPLARTIASPQRASSVKTGLRIWWPSQRAWDLTTHCLSSVHLWGRGCWRKTVYMWWCRTDLL